MRIEALDSYAERLGGLPESAFIGSLVWFSISGLVEHEDGVRTMEPVRVRREWLVEQFDKLGLEQSILPVPPTKVHAFRSACTYVSGYKYAGTERDVTIELLVRDVSSDGERVEKQITMEKRDKKGLRLSYWKVATVIFYRGDMKDRKQGGGFFKCRLVSGLSDTDKAEVDNLLNNLRLKYDDLCAHLHGDLIRTIVRNYLKHLNAISVRGGGLYFTHRTRQAEMDALMQLVRSIGQGCIFGQAPLVDTDEQRLMLSEAYQDSVADDCRLLLDDVAAANAKGTIAPKVYERLLENWRTISSRASEYSDQLGLAQTRAATSLEMSLEGILALEKSLG
jgi:hypothetical protein